MITPRDVNIAGKTYKVLYNTTALWKMEEAMGESFFAIIMRMGARSTGVRDTLGLLYGGLEAARLELEPNAPAWTMKRVSALMDQVTGGVVGFVAGTDIADVRAALSEGLPKNKADDAKPGDKPDTGEVPPLDGTSSGRATSTVA